MADDFEKAVLFSFDQTGSVDAALKVCVWLMSCSCVTLEKACNDLAVTQDRAVTYCNEYRAQPQCWQLCLEKYSNTAYMEIRFWCLQTLHEVCEAHIVPVIVH